MANLSVSSIERGLAVLELLVDHDDGLQVSSIAQQLSLPLSATHRLLQALVNANYVKQEASSERYVPTLKLGAMGLRLLAGTSVTEVAQPILDDLAHDTGELVRLAVVEDCEMIWVAKAQGATGAIRCDPISGRHVPLHTTGMGKAWLASMPEEDAIAMVEARGFDCELLGPNAIRTIAELRVEIRRVRELGFAFNDQESELGLSAIAMLIKERSKGDRVVGAVSIGGPTFRVDRERLLSFVGPLRAAIDQLEQLWPVRAHALAKAR